MLIVGITVLTQPALHSHRQPQHMDTDTDVEQPPTLARP